MSIETSSSPVGADQESTIPELRTFQKLGTSIGRVTETVNLFRGSVSFPLTLLTLANRGGLQADVVLTYDSEVQLDVTTRNLESPTGIVGLGWSLPYEMILLDYRGSVSPYDDAYYLASTDGSQNRLRMTARTDDAWTFEGESYDFSAIVYYPSRQIWRITGPDGMVRIYGADVAAGDDPAALRHAVKWGGADGNWTGPTVAPGQSLFPISWNLARVENPWGDAISFTYTHFADDEIQIGGSSDVRYTRASYLETIVDPSGRTVKFEYADKIYDETIREYQVPHQNPQDGGPVAYQDRYETRYLQGLEVTQEVDGAPQALTNIRLFYSVELFADSSTPGTPADLYKRYLTGVSTVNADGKLLPGLRFDYYTGAESSGTVHRGALKSVQYPEGGVASYTYSAQPIPGTSLDLTLNSSDPDWEPGTPRYWVGPDYVILAKCDALGSRLTVSVFDWNGRWLESKPIAHDLASPLDLTTIDVAFQDDFFVLSYRLTSGAGNGAIEAWAVNRVFGRYGVWSATALAVPLLSTSDASYSVVAGRGFVVAAASGQSVVRRSTWDPRSKKWNADDLEIITSAEGEWSVAAYDNFFTLCQFQPGMPLSLTIHYMDLATRAWNDELPPIDSIGTFVWQSDLPKLSFSLSDSFASATYLVAADQHANTVDYAVRIYLWDESFSLLPSPRPIVGTQIPADTKEPVFLSMATGSLVGNVGNIRRYDGAEWISGTFGSFAEGDSLAHFAYAGDLAVGSSGVRGTIAVYDPWLGQVNTVLANVGAQGPEAPTVSGRLITVRNRIYEQGPTGDLTLLDQQLPLDAISVSNQAPLFLVYGMPNGEAFAWLLKNGALLPAPVPLVGWAFAPEVTGPGMDLVGPLAFVTYVGPSFDEPSQITLHRVLDRRVGGAVPSFVVSSVTVDDGLGAVSQAAFEYDGPGATGTVGPFGLASQYTQVKAAVGTDSTSVTPFGHSIYRYYDGLAPDGAAPDFLYSLANGLLREVTAYDSTGAPVARTSRTWEIVTSATDAATGVSKTLVGAYSRIATSTETIYDVSPLSTPQAPLPVTTTYSYDEANGQPRYTESPNHDSVTGAVQIVRDEYEFAYEIYPAMAGSGVHTITQPASKRTTVDGALIRYEATTWKRAGVGAWAPFRQFLARGAGSTLTADDWANVTEPSNAAWKKLSEVVERDARGELLEYVDEQGRAVSVVLDARQRFVVARAENASRAAEQLAYVGFEAYEDLAGWTLGGSSSALAGAVRSGDSFTGLRSLVMGGSSVPGSSPLRRVLSTREPSGRKYTLACWIKTPAGFVDRPGEAALHVSIGATTVTRDIPDTDGAWLDVCLVVDVPAGVAPETVTLTVTNTRDEALLVDDVSFSPVMCAFSATVYDPARLLPIAVVRGTSAMTRTLRGDFDETESNVDSLDATVEISTSYLSRRGNRGALSATDLNSVLRIVPRGWGFYQSFSLGDVFEGAWSSATEGAWTTSRGKLRHTGSASDAIAFDGFPALEAGVVDVFGASLRATPAGALSAPLGMSFGATHRVTWSPLDSTWTLSRGGTPLATAAPRSMLDLSYAAYGPTLAQGALPAGMLPPFEGAGLPLAPTSTVAVLSSAAWRVSDASTAAIYYLVRSSADPATIHVTAFPREWTLLVVDRTIVLFADGGRVMSYDESSPPSRALGLFATDEIAFDNAVFFTDPGLSVTHLDGEGRVRQEQVFTTPSFVASATIYDALGRGTVKSQGATLTPAPGAWGAYQADLANLSWTTLMLSGVVADQNPESGGFAYARTRHEDSPLGRKVELGAPGAAYAITPSGAGDHTRRYRYGLNDASFGLPAGLFATTTSVSPDGVTRVDLVDQRRATVASAVLATTPPASAAWTLTRMQYDAAGNLVRSTTPRGWSDTFEWDFLGQQIGSTRANEGQSYAMYDSIGRLRFTRDARGAGSPQYIRYWKYDAVSRVIEEGCSLEGWPGALAAHVDDPTYPTATPSNRYVYDFVVPAEDPTNLLARGMLTRAESANQVSVPAAPGAPAADDFVAVQTFVYDVYAAVATHTLVVDGADGDATSYGYNNQGEILSVQYPGTGGALVSYERDLLGRVAAIGVDGNRCAVYTYNRNGGIATETMFDGAGARVGDVRTFAYAPPGWLSANVGSALDERLTYAPTTTGGAGLYGGTPSRIVTAARGGREPVAAAFTLDPVGRLASADFGAGPSPFTYDDNGNIQRLGGSTNSYAAETRDRLVARADAEGTQTFEYDADGNLTTRAAPTAPPQAMTLTWDCFRGAPLDARLGPPATTQAVRYDYLNRRLSKVVTSPSGGSSTKRYLRGAGADPLVERVIGGVTTELIHGPRGLVQVRVDGTPFHVVTDQLGSVRAILDAHAGIVGAYDYLPFGALRGPATGSNPNVIAYRFTDREVDATGLYDFRARLYDPLAGRFVSPDPAHELVSPYIYANNNPLVFVDPSGEFIEWIIAAFAAAAAAIAEAAVEIATLTAVGAAIGFGIGVVQGAVTVASANLSGAKAAGVFFGTVVLSTAGGALSGGAGALTSSLAEGVTVGSAAALLGGAVVQGGISAAQSAGQAALVGDDPGVAAWQNAIAGGLSFAAGTFAAGGTHSLLANAALKGTQKAAIAGAVSGAVGGAAGGVTDAALNRTSEQDTLSSIIQGVAYGLFGGIAPEIIGYKFAKGRLTYATEMERRSAVLNQQALQLETGNELL